MGCSASSTDRTTDALQEALKDARVATRFDHREVERMCQEWFNIAPHGSLTFTGFTRFVTACELFPSEANTSNVHTRALFQKLDMNNDESISFKEFMCAIAVMIRGEPDEKIIFLFAVCDVENRGEVSFEDWKNLVVSFNADLDTCKLRELFTKFDTNHDGMLSLEEFKILSRHYQQHLLHQDAGIHDFNSHPRSDSCLAKLCEGHSVPADDDSAVAELLYSLCTEKSSISLLAIGEHIGQERQEKRLEAYLSCCNFKELYLDDALRALSNVLIIPGEAQVVSRVLNQFSRVYQRDNPQCFPDEDRVFLVSFSLMMLNTDLHNPAIPNRKKMNKAEYLRNMRGQNIEESVLEELYDRIKLQEIKLAPNKASERDALTSVIHETTTRMSMTFGSFVNSDFSENSEEANDGGLTSSSIGMSVDL